MDSHEIVPADSQGSGQGQALALHRFRNALDYSWLQYLSPDPATLVMPLPENKRSRPVLAGHYVAVNPTPLPNPKLVIHSQLVATDIGIPQDEVMSDAFTDMFSGNQAQFPEVLSWCTPYALAIMGERITDNCPFRNDTGYGDGRAISIAEVVINNSRWELQLKGAGTTPFCRGGDGRAVLRSSVREFLASEAMYHLGVPTTRALCLIVSGSESVKRPWYSGQVGTVMGDEPDIVQNEWCAITTRAAPSFIRVGHLDLFARRVSSGRSGKQQQLELEQMVEHLLYREFPSLATDGALSERALAMLPLAADHLGTMVAGWLRVGFCQGNFNSDNCLVSGRTMDYGPFGWMDVFDAKFSKWTGAGDHYSFMNQPNAAIANFEILIDAILKVVPSSSLCQKPALVSDGARIINARVAEVWRIKLGFTEYSSLEAAEIWSTLQPLMQNSHVDYTMFWRQLALVAQGSSSHSVADNFMKFLLSSFYELPSESKSNEWVSWLHSWLKALSDAGSLEGAAVRMRAASPKYVPREWMLAEAYSKAAYGDYSMVHELYNLFLHPYDELPAYEGKYYCKSPIDATIKGGIAHMS